MSFDRSVFDKVQHNTKVIVNGAEYEAFGIGKANQGLLSSQLSHNFKFDPEILAVHLIVGYPTYSEYKEGATDLFKPSTLNGGYKYQRKYRFSNGATFSSYHNISFDKESGLSGVFSTANFPADKFEGQQWAVQDLVETFIPSGPGLIKSVMGVEWQGPAGNLTAIVESEYFLNHNMTLPDLHWRHVTFATEKSSPGVYIQSEKITVHRDLREAVKPINLLAEFQSQSIDTTVKSKQEADQARVGAVPVKSY